MGLEGGDCSGNSGYVLVDAHVHMQNCFSLAHFFHSAYGNFKRVGDSVGGGFSAVLMLSEAGDAQYFKKLQKYSNELRAFEDPLYGTWKILATNEEASVEARNAQGESIMVIAGRQVITKEKLEVLALMTRSDFDDGNTLGFHVEEIRESGGVPVIPWGVGKWLGKRGETIKAFMQSTPNNNFFLGDNGGRPTFWPDPELFGIGRAMGVAVLPGSDPLPLKNEVKRVGSYGFSLPNKLITRAPAAELKERLLSENVVPTAYGSLQAPLTFLNNQLRIRIK